MGAENSRFYTVELRREGCCLSCQVSHAALRRHLVCRMELQYSEKGEERKSGDVVWLQVERMDWVRSRFEQEAQHPPSNSQISRPYYSEKKKRVFHWSF